MTLETRFDMASLTKPLATATAAMILIEQGKLGLTDRFTTHLPEFDNNGKGAITIERLLRHRSGFVPDNPLSDYSAGPEQAWTNLSKLALRDRPGERFVYSDVNFIVLGKVIERITGVPLDEFCAQAIFEPLGMKDTGFRRIEKSDTSPAAIARIAPSEREGELLLRGVVHDPRSRALGGVAGHAGLFSTADDVALFAQMLLDGGIGTSGKRVLSPLSVRALISAGDTPATERRGLGWDVDTSFSAPRRSSARPASAIPDLRARASGLTSRPRRSSFCSRAVCIRRFGRTSTSSDRRLPISWPPRSLMLRSSPLESLAIEAAAPSRSVAPTRPVSCGIDVLVRRSFDILKGNAWGL